MRFTEYIDSHHVFTTAALMAAADSPGAAREQLRRAVRAGDVERARRGLLVSNHGRFEGAPVDSAEIVSALDPSAALSYHSALAAWGVEHQVGFACQFRSDTVKTGFSFRGMRYEPCGPLGNAETATIRVPWGRRRVTTRERTVLDCLDRPALAGGAEEAVRGASAFAWLDVDELVAMAVGEGSSACARTGWLLSEKADDWHVVRVQLAQLAGMLGKGPYRLGHPRGHVGWSGGWRLLLPDEEEEVRTWVTHL